MGSPQWKLRWSKVPELVRRDLIMHYLTAKDIVTLDTAVAEKEERKHLVKAYVGFSSAGLDRYAYILKRNGEKEKNWKGRNKVKYSFVEIVKMCWLFRISW